MNKINLAFTLLFCFNTFAQSPEIEWQKAYGGSAEDIARKLKPTNDGGYIVAGNTYSNDGDLSGNNGNADAWIVKLNDAGGIQWQQNFGSINTNYVNSIQQTSDGGYIFAGAFYEHNEDLDMDFSDLWVVKIDALGTIVWEKKLGGVFWDSANDIKQTQDGGYIVAGSTGIDPDVWIVKLDPAGNVDWEKTYGGLDFDSADSISLTTDGGYIIGANSASDDGDITNPHGGFDFWVIKLDNLGNMEWQKSYGGSDTDSIAMISQTDDGGYAMIGSTFSTDGDITQPHGVSDWWFLKTDPMGTIEWQKTFGGSLGELATSFQETIEGGFILGGYENSTDGDVLENQGGSDYFIIKISQEGELEWQKSLGGTGFDQLQDVVQTADAGFILAGSVVSNDGDITGNHGDYDFWIVKLSPYLVTQSFNEKELFVFPNPVSDFINVQLPDAKMIDAISITEMTGKTVLQQNASNTKINVEKLDVGIYILKVYALGQSYQTQFIKK